jgi:hypothetical protein
MDEQLLAHIEATAKWIRAGVIVCAATGGIAASAAIVLATRAGHVPEHTHPMPPVASHEAVRAQRFEIVDPQGNLVGALVAAPKGLGREGLAVVDKQGRPRAVIETSDASSGLVLYDGDLKQRAALTLRADEGAGLTLYDGTRPRTVLYANEKRGRAGLILVDANARPRVGLNIDDQKGESLQLFGATGNATYMAPTQPAPAGKR